jgi:hypothetical protein
MKLWYLELTELGYKEIGGYDYADEIVVRAETEAQAREVALQVAADGWLNPEYATCVELTYEGEPAVITYKA